MYNINIKYTIIYSIKSIQYTLYNCTLYNVQCTTHSLQIDYIQSCTILTYNTVCSLSRTLLIALWVWAITWSSYFIPRHRSSRQVFFHQMSPLFSTFATLLLRSNPDPLVRPGGWRLEENRCAQVQHERPTCPKAPAYCWSVHRDASPIFDWLQSDRSRALSLTGWVLIDWPWNVLVVLFTWKWLGCLGTELCEAYSMSFEFCCFCQALCG